MIKRIIASIPNTITCLNLLSGAIASILAFHSVTQFGALTGWQWAFIFIGAAAVFDFCDGASARLLHAYSLIGKELDSLADLISFGLAPSLLLYNTIALAEGCGPLCWYALPALFIVAMGALRLARFNVDDRQTTEFIGLPIPANAIFWIGFIAWIHATGIYPGFWITTALILAVGLLMVSPMRMFSLKFKNFAFGENFRRYLLLGSAILLVVWQGIPGLAWTILLYILISATDRRRA